MAAAEPRRPKSSQYFGDVCPDRADQQVREPSNPESTELRVCSYGEDHVLADELTFVPTRTGRLTLAVLLDFYSRRIVGIGISLHQTFSVVVEAWWAVW